MPGFELVVHMDDAIADRLTRLKSAITGNGASAGRPKQPATAGTAPPSAVASPANPKQEHLLRQIAGVQWYHTLDLGEGVVTPGFFDHRPVLAHYHLPESLKGMRVLDVATYNGFWAFEFERRGADEVIALDIDRVEEIDWAPAERARLTQEELKKPVGTGFEIARSILGAKVKREVLNIYDLSPARVGMFDLVFLGDLLLHLTNPVKALQNVCSVTRGSLLISEMFDPYLDRSGPEKALHYHGGHEDHVWWTFGRTTLEQMIQDAGFQHVELLDTFDLTPRGYTKSPPHALFRARK